MIPEIPLVDKDRLYANTLDMREIAEKARREKNLAIVNETIRKREENIPHDTKAVDTRFVEAFMCYYLEEDICWIAREFLETHVGQLGKYAEHFWSYTDETDSCKPETALKRRIINLIYSAVKMKDPYAVALMKYLYKIYFEDEYYELKKHTVINVHTLFEIGRSREANGSFYRAFGMCSILGIRLVEKDEPIYILMTNQQDDIMKEKEAFFEAGKLDCVKVRESEKNLLKLFPEDFDTSIFDPYFKSIEFLDACMDSVRLPHLNMPDCIEDPEEMRSLFARARVLLEKTDHERSDDLAHIQICAVILQLAEQMYEERV